MALLATVPLNQLKQSNVCHKGSIVCLTLRHKACQSRILRENSLTLPLSGNFAKNSIMPNTAKPLSWGSDIPVAFRPSSRLFLAMVRRITRDFGGAITARMLSVTPLQLERWLAGQFKPAKTSERVVWLIYCMLYDPKRIRTVTDLLTWGRLRE